MSKTLQKYFKKAYLLFIQIIVFKFRDLMTHVDKFCYNLTGDIPIGCVLTGFHYFVIMTLKKKLRLKRVTKVGILHLSSMQFIP